MCSIWLMLNTAFDPGHSRPVSHANWFACKWFLGRPEIFFSGVGSKIRDTTVNLRVCPLSAYMYICITVWHSRPLFEIHTLSRTLCCWTAQQLISCITYFPVQLCAQYLTLLIIFVVCPVKLALKAGLHQSMSNFLRWESTVYAAY